MKQADLRALVWFKRDGDFFEILNSLFEDSEFILCTVVKFIFWYVLKERFANVVLLVITIQFVCTFFENSPCILIHNLHLY